jgi:hypothetical protein
MCAGERVQITTEPVPGFYQRRMVKHGPMVPVAIWIDQDIDPETGELMADEVMRCLVNGKDADAQAQWSDVAGHPITEREYRFLTASVDYARQHAPEMPLAQPRQAIDLLTAPLPF